MKIQKLPAEARSKLQSGVIVTDAVQCVLELVRNSLDAEATGIAVRVDLKTYQIRVIDNGKGIGKNDLEFVGERFMTSKYHISREMETSFPTYGFTGQALSSLQDVSRTLTIETRSEDGGPTFVKVFQNKKALPVAETDSERNGTGTVVTVDDFMYTMPVRRKRINEVFDMEEIKNQLQYLAIIHYSVCFTLRNENKGLILLQTPKASSMLESITNIYGKTVAKSLKEISYNEKKYEVSGFVSLKPQTQSNIQLLYLNKRIVSKGMIHKFVNSLIKEYSGKKCSLGDSPTGDVLKMLKSSHNVYIIQIKCPQCYYELFTNGRKVTVEFRNWKDPLKFIHKAVKRTFKGVLNLDSTTNTQHPDDKKEEESSKQSRGVFGTSLLVNAVRGTAAKRCHNSRSFKNRKKTQSNEDKVTQLPKVSKNLESLDNQKRNAIRNLDNRMHPNESLHDSFESPIPKKAVKNVKVSPSKLRKSDINQSFIEFCEWLKSKFETDSQALNLYNDFLQFKSRKVQSEVAEFRSPVLGVKRKGKEGTHLEKKSPKKKMKALAKDLSVINEEMAFVTQKQLKIFPNQHLRMQKAVKFTAEMSTNIQEAVNVGPHFRSENDHFEMHYNQFQKPEGFSCIRNERQVEYSHTFQSLPSSELQFTNIIKFRNMSENFIHHSVNGNFLQEKTFSGSNTWVSHYQDVGLFGRNRILEANEESKFSWRKVNAERAYQRRSHSDDLYFLNTSEPRLEFGNESRKVVEDVEVQVNMLSLPRQKANAVVQTFQKVSESSSFENSFTFSQGVTRTAAGDNTHISEELHFSNNNFSQEVPNPDFWNFTSQMEFEINNHQTIGNEVNTNKSSDDITNKENLSTNEFFCGHKSQLSTKVESTSKETQTLAAIWTDSLTNLGYPTEDVSIESANLNNSKSNSTQLSQGNTIPKTVPIEEINCDMAESGFCMTERHDFVPKGLSPKFLNPETTTVASLSPSEKCKIQLTIDNTQNEFLTTIKWQNESSGDCVKPAIPDGIIFELRQKARENLMSYENPVLSATLSYCAVKVHNLLHSFAFTRELLSGVEVLGQLDKKFIVTRMKISTPKKMELISLFDQHAADERIKLEELLNENISSDGRFISSRLKSPVECTLTESEVRVVCDLKDKMFNFGLRSEPVNENRVSINEVPTFLLKKHENNPRNKKETSLSDAVRALILNIIEEMTETRGAVSKIPKVLHNAFCLEACRKAIKFNKPLSAENMTEMITKLRRCKLPFQCAHGRPSVIPIIDLEDFRPTVEENETLDAEKLRKFLNERKEDSVLENSKSALN